MAYGFTSLEKRLKENVRNYHIKNLFQMNELQEYLKCIATTAGVNLLLTDRHGEKAVAIGDFADFHPDVVTEPGRKLRIEDRTVGHLYSVNRNERPDRKENAEELLDEVLIELAAHARTSYELIETSIYADELEEKLEKELYQAKHGVKTDALTGMMNKAYFTGRIQVIDRAEVIPVAAVCININDWKYANNHYGDDESDRLIQIVADLCVKESKPDYVIGRVDGDVFHIVIPMAEEEEAKSYCNQIQKRCSQYVDNRLAPSIAYGIVMKSNVEQTLTELLSEAEYEMFQNKFEVKNAPGYRERLEKKESK
ncbi:MAG: diguanylate cyclase [Lachnospiraceae bacterium]